MPPIIEERGKKYVLAFSIAYEKGLMDQAHDLPIDVVRTYVIESIGHDDFSLVRVLPHSIRLGD